MNYQETVDFLFSRLPMFTRDGGAAYKNNLDNITHLCDFLNKPHTQFKSIHIGGTNGKGSSSSLLASVLQESGYKVGLFTSPHLYDFRERIRINGNMISEEYVIDFVERCKSFIESDQPSFFELTTAMAFAYFAEEKVDIAVIEVGMGGRLDSTNIISPILSAITYIGMDHEQFLGNTLTLIAGEKAGIIKENTPIVIGKTQPEIESVFRDKALECNSHIYYADKIVDFARVNDKWTLLNRSSQEIIKFEPQLSGDYQVDNYRLVIVMIELLRDMGYSISKDHIISGLESVIQNTGIQGRFQILKKNPLIIADVAHNKDGIAQVIHQVLRMNMGKLFILIGFMKDKNRSEIYNLLPRAAHYIAIQAHTPRALPYMELYQELNDHNFQVDGIEDINEALAWAKSKAEQNDTILIIGSFFTLAELRVNEV